LPDGPDGPADAALAAMFYRSFQRFAAFWVPSQRLADDLRERFCLSDSEAQRLGVVPAACLPHAVPLSAQDIEPSAEARPIQVLGYAPGLDAPETDVFMALLGQQNAEACQGTLVFDHLGKQRRYGYFPKHVEICGAGEPAVGAALDSADLWLMCGQDLDAPMSAAQSGVPFVAPRDICQALGLDLKLCWCPPETAQGLPGLATAFASALAASPEERRRRAEALREQLAAQAPLEVMSRAVGARLSELTQGEQPKDIPVPDPAAAPMPSEDQQGGQKAASHQDLSPEALLTVAITAHSESHVAAPMLRSVARAIEMLQVARPDAQIELMVGFDSPTSTCRAFFDRTLPEVFPDARCLAFDFRDQGKTRNALARAARGRFFAVVDADDLVSENWLSGAVALLEEREAQGIDTIAHPEVNWQFDAVQRVYSNPDQSDPLFSPHAMAIANYYDAMCVAPTRLWRALPYADRDLAQGFALEDYQWFVEATALGWRHANVPDTVIFKRRRDASQHRDSRREGALIRAIAPLAIDALRDSLKREKPGAEASAAQKSDGFARSQQDRKRPSPLARLGALFKQQK